MSLILRYCDSQSALVPSWTCNSIKLSCNSCREVDRRELGTTQTISNCGSFLITCRERKTIRIADCNAFEQDSGRLQWRRSHVWYLLKCVWKTQCLSRQTRSVSSRRKKERKKDACLAHGMVKKTSLIENDCQSKQTVKLWLQDKEKSTGCELGHFNHCSVFV